MANISKVQLPNSETIYDIRDNSALHMSSTAIGSTSTPIYWTGSAFETATNVGGTSTDEKVRQTADASTTDYVPALLAYSTSPTSGVSGTAKYVAKVGVAPSTAKLKASTYALNLPDGSTEASVTVSATADGGWIWEV